MTQYPDSLDDVIKAASGVYARKDSAHDIEHALRVMGWGRKLALEEGANVTVVELSALLHDIGRSGAVEMTHAESSAGLSVSILRRFKYPENVVDAVKAAILAHSREAGYEPKTIEAKILYDADKLDFVGPVGIARLFILSGINGWGLTGNYSCEQFYRERIVHYRDFIYTSSAKKYFDPLLSYMEDFWEKLHQQMA